MNSYTWKYTGQGRKGPKCGIFCPRETGVRPSPSMWVHTLPQKLFETVLLSFYDDFMTQAGTIKPWAIGD